MSNVAPDLDVPVLANIALPLLIARVKRGEAEALAMEALERVGVGECAQQSWGSLADWERRLSRLLRGSFVVRGCCSSMT